MWRPFALLGEPAAYLWIGGAAVVTLASVAYVLRHGSAWSILGLVVLWPFLLWGIASGNGNAYLGPALAWAWLFRRQPIPPAFAVVTASAFKVAPAILGIWLLFDRRRFVAALAYTVILVVAAVLFAPGSWQPWFPAAFSSLPMFSLADLLSWPATVVAVLCGLAVLGIRAVTTDERRVFAAAVVATFVASPQLELTTPILLFPLLVLWPRYGHRRADDTLVGRCSGPTGHTDRQAENSAVRRGSSRRGPLRPSRIQMGTKKEMGRFLRLRTR